MTRWISFIVLAAIVVLFGFLFYQVMAQFLLPLFMAVVLVIIFYPMHARFVKWFGGRQRVAAAVTTVTVMFIVLLPFFLILSMAAAEGVSLATRLAQPETLVDLQRFRNRIGLAWPSKEVRNTNELVKTRLHKIDDMVAAVESGISPDAKSNLDRLLKDTQQEMSNLMRDLVKGKQNDLASGLWREDQELTWVIERQQATEMLAKLIVQVGKLDEELLIANEKHATESGTLPTPPLPAHPPNDEPVPPTEPTPVPPPFRENSPPATETKTPSEKSSDEQPPASQATVDQEDALPETATPDESHKSADSSSASVPETSDEPASGPPAIQVAQTPTSETPAPVTEEPNFLSGMLEDFNMSSFLPGGGTPTMSAIPPPIEKELAAQMVALPEQYGEFERMLLGPSWVFGIKAIANPDDETVSSLLGTVQEWVAPVAKGTAGILVNLIIGLAVMMVALYYFLADGKSMVATLMKLSPLDDRHEEALLLQFQTISRAVVTATLATAVAQGMLSGVGFYFAGLRQQAFLLTLVTMLTSMIPFVGAAAVWISCSLYLLLVEGNISSAVGLALWGGIVVSMADNLIKPLILHGQSNLHPLLALLSVVGGVTALGPVGIFIGPMVVAFLQALLNILHNELLALERESNAQNGVLALGASPPDLAEDQPQQKLPTAKKPEPLPPETTPVPPSATKPQTPSMKKNTGRKSRNKR